MLAACRKLYPANNFYYINDGARSHIIKTVQLLERGSQTSLCYHGQWPPCSPDLNPLEFFFWTQVKRKVYKGNLTTLKNLDKLKRKITSLWQSCCDLLTIRWPYSSSEEDRKLSLKLMAYQSGKFSDIF